MVPWATPTQAQTFWADAKNLSDDILVVLLDAATEQCAAYAPALAVDATVPDRYVLATVYQAREVYSAGQRDGDVIGIGDHAIRSRPLTATVKSLLRPQRVSLRFG
ncbi:hypothetical protein BN12_40053 [Nostocoides japonicum T1-X7]|uniref:Uncharacterized protein n=1 Tax=Nostocoides japonicum T1-X7 TaxID=1194083 RepID=A0A077LYU5_9MICO|nr:hypothetical protein [Tetrasphaera japonica]CCH79083.1 hypothetical protein BN12_40053 [Tetrasphaera japonica T1-X7]